MGKIFRADPNPRFKKYKSQFTNLLKRNQIVTQYPIVSMIISRDSQKGISVQKIDEKRSVVEMHDLTTLELTFSEIIKGDFIKVKEVV